MSIRKRVFRAFLEYFRFRKTSSDKVFTNRMRKFFLKFLINRIQTVETVTKFPKFVFLPTNILKNFLVILDNFRVNLRRL